ncbi:glycosyltransferase [Arthrobacter sp. 31Y]|uniref:glycosyltransferase n=1 Tax=Arthrobacter sp. 31Y TaxID=1115632 RepID=UPI000463ACAA|nr:glycosyltransferase [Arthrobacter sp. 31Y]
MTQIEGMAAANLEAAARDQEDLEAEAMAALEEQESKPVFVGHTRFSVHSPNSGAWVASNGSKMTEAEYLEHLFSDERMEPRADIFFNYTLPMLAYAAKASDVLFRHVVSYSDSLPRRYQDQMEAAAAQFPFVLLDKVPAGGGGLNTAKAARALMLEAGLPIDTVFGSMRLDDDDILSADYFDQMAQYLTEAHVGYVVTLARGVTALYENGEFFYARDAVYPLHSKGHLSICRYNRDGSLSAPVGTSHNRSDRANPVILDSRKFSHIWVRSVNQDTALYQLAQGREGQLARIYQDMEQYPVLTEMWEDAFPQAAGRLHTYKPDA